MVTTPYTSPPPPVGYDLYIILYDSCASPSLISGLAARTGKQYKGITSQKMKL